jgi:hypothetical protein
MNRLLVALLIPAGVALTALLLEWNVRRRVGFGRTNDENRFHFYQGMTSPAGYSLLRRLDPLLAKLQLRAALAASVPFAIWAGYATVELFDASVVDLPGGILLVAAGVLLESYLIFHYRRTRDRHAVVKAGYEAKLVTAQELARHVAPGDYICHEFCTDGLWIDHVLVSSKGIFAIQTHPRAVAEPCDLQGGRLVTYDGRQLLFPQQNDDDDVVEYARDTAEQMSAWLSDALNTPVAIRAIVSVPGWTVRRTSAEGISVVNPGQFGSLFQHITPWSLSPAEIDAVIRVITTTYEARLVTEGIRFQPNGREQ